MLLLLALGACVDEEAVVGTDAPPEDGPGTTVDADAGASIATTPDRAPPSRAPVRPAPLPGGELVVNDCFGSANLEGAMTRRGAGYGGPSGGVLGGTTGAGSGAGALPPPAARPRPAPSPVASQPAASAPASMPQGQSVAEAPVATTPVADSTVARHAGGEKKAAEEAKTEAGPADEADRKDVLDAVAARPQLDWGATVWLSNDDSMSLASAQRVLYALKQGLPLRTSEIRPHELLNYFSFDSAEPAPGRVFSVLGAAEQHGDTLSVSLAVRGASPQRDPLDLTLLVDRSCSMSAEGRMDYTKRGLQLMTDQLQQGDRVDLVLFDSTVCTPIHDFVVGRDDPSVLTDTIAKLRPTTGTNLDAGLQTAYALQTSRDPADVHGRNRRVLLVTDALLNEGRVNQSLVAQVGTNLEQHDIRLSGVGVGRDFNDAMLDQLTENGKGAYVYLGSEAVVDRVFGPGFDALTRTVAHDVHFALELPPSLAMERFYGEEASTNKEDVKPIHYFAGTTQLFLQDLAIRPGGLVPSDPVTMRIEYRDAHTGEPQVQELRTTVGALLEGDPHNLHKGQALMAFSDVVLARSMGADACGAPLDTYRQRTALVADDAEIAYVNGLVGGLCHVPMTTVVSRGVQLKLRLDSDQPIADVNLVCGGASRHQAVSASDPIARFDGLQPGSCTVELAGNLPMSAEIEVPEAGGDVRCLVRGGRVSCT